MKQDIHPVYYPNAKITCACGNAFQIGSTKETMEVEVCSNCHPFYTGKDTIMDKVGRVQKFRERLAKKTPKRARGKKQKRENKKRMETKRQDRARVTRKAARNP